MIWFYKNRIRSRSPYFQKLASQLEMQFRENDTEGFGTYLKDIRIFKRARPKKQINNIVFKEIPDPLENLYFFDFHYVINTGQSSAIIDQTVFFAQSKKITLPNFELKPKNPGQLLLDFFGKKRPDLGHPLLNKKFLLKTESPKVLDWLNEDAFIEILERYPKLYIHGANYHLVIFQPRKKAHKDFLKEQYNDFFSLYEHFQQYKEKENF